MGTIIRIVLRSLFGFGWKTFRNRRKTRKQLKKAKFAAKYGKSGKNKTAINPVMDVKNSKNKPVKSSGSSIFKLLGLLKFATPVLLPIIMQLINNQSTKKNAKKSDTLGIPLLDLGKYSANGSKLTQRLDSLRKGLAQLEQSSKGNLDVKSFVNTTYRKLNDLSNTINTAEKLPSARRSGAQSAVDNELKLIENDLISQWGITEK